VICATAANVFLVREGTLVTPDIRDCGVAGVMRGIVLAAARELAIFTEVRDVRQLDFVESDEVFLTNAITASARWARSSACVANAAPGEVTRRLLEHTSRVGA